MIAEFVFDTAIKTLIRAKKLPIINWLKRLKERMGREWKRF